MTSEEKAKELVEKMYQKFDTSNYQDFDIDESDNDLNSKLWERNNDLFIKIYKTYAKQCALIAVEEVKEAIFWHPYESPNFELEYWNEVMNEIEKL